MGLLTLTGITAVVMGSGALYVRRKLVRKWLDVRDNDTKLTGKTVIITGGNIGLGYETALDLARRNSHVVIACRNAEKGQEAVQSIREETQNEAVECLELDLADLSSVRTFASTVQSKYSNIHAVILNAGVWVPMDQEKKTRHGLEIHFGVNHLGHFELARLLKDHLLHQGSDCRIIFVASTLARSGQLDLDAQDFVKEGRSLAEDAKPSFAPTAYCDSKLMNILCCKHLATLLPPNDNEKDGSRGSVTTYAVSPGFCRSSLGRNVPHSFLTKLALVPLLRLIQRTAAQGAQNIVFLTIADTSELQSGAVYSDGQVNEELTEYVDSLGSDVPRRLWDLSEKISNEIP